MDKHRISDFYSSRRVLITGHTGFKGSWLSKILIHMGAEVYGYSLEPPTDPSLYYLSGLKKHINSHIGDVRDYGELSTFFDTVKPEIVFHMAAQPIVRESYKNPKYTYETNVMGTVNLLECVRCHPEVKSVLNVTTDKVYHNNEWVWGYRENDSLDGFDPYSNSKSCSELVTHCYNNSFFRDTDTSVSTARAGNVIGGGDFARDRIIPDCIRAMKKKDIIEVRNPHSTRPYQHVMEPLFAYLLIAMKQFNDKKYSDYYNVGPDDTDCLETGELVDLFCRTWGEGAEWENKEEVNAPHEANFLKLDCSKIKSIFGWNPTWHIDKAVRATCEFAKAWIQGEDVSSIMDMQINQFIGE